MYVKGKAHQGETPASRQAAMRAKRRAADGDKAQTE